MSTIIKEFTKEQLIEQAKKNIEVLRGAVERIPGASDAAVIHLKLAEITLASLEAEPVAWTDADELRDVKNGGNGYLFAIGGEANKFADPRRQMMLYTAPPAPANAEPVAWLWSHRKHPSEVTLVRPEDDEMGEPGLWSGWSCQALYAAPPAPVSVPDLKPVGFLFVSDDGAVAYSPADWPMKGFNLIGQIYGDVNACRPSVFHGGK